MRRRGMLRLREGLLHSLRNAKAGIHCSGNESIRKATHDDATLTTAQA